MLYILFKISLKKGEAGLPFITIRLNRMMCKSQRNEIIAKKIPRINLRT